MTNKIRAKNREERITTINNLIDKGYSQYAIAGILGISRQRVSQLLSPEKHSARHKVAVAVADDPAFKPKVCSQCGTETRLHAHHPNYNKPLDVTWLCRKCHGLAHRKVKAESPESIASPYTHIKVEKDTKAKFKKLSESHKLSMLQLFNLWVEKEYRKSIKDDPAK